MSSVGCIWWEHTVWRCPFHWRFSLTVNYRRRMRPTHQLIGFLVCTRTLAHMSICCHITYHTKHVVLNIPHNIHSGLFVICLRHWPQRPQTANIGTTSFPPHTGGLTLLTISRWSTVNTVHLSLHRKRMVALGRINSQWPLVSSRQDPAEIALSLCGQFEVFGTNDADISPKNLA